MFDTLFKILMLFYFFAAICVTGRLLPWWAYVNTLQIILHTVLFSVQMPGNVAIFLLFLLDIARFNFIPYNQWILDSRDAWQEEGAFNEVFNQNGYTSYYCVPNLGLFFLMFVLFTVLWLIAHICDKVFARCGITNVYVNRPFEQILCNFNARFFFEAYLEIAICAAINVINLNANTSEAAFSSLMCVIFLCLLLSFYVWIFTLFFRGGPYRINDEYITYKYGQTYRYKTIYLGMSLMKLEYHTMYPMFFLIRRNIYAFSVVAMVAYPVGQVWLLLISSLFMLMLLCTWRPFEGVWWYNPLQIFNEATIYVVAVHLLMFNDYILSYITREAIGVSLIVTVVLWSLVNFLTMYYFLIRHIVLYCRKRKLLYNWTMFLMTCQPNNCRNRVHDKVAKKPHTFNNRRKSIQPIVEDPNEPAFMTSINNLSKNMKSENLDVSHLSMNALMKGHKETFIDLDDG